MSETPRIWIGSLAAYNAGTLLGAWFDAIDAPTSPREWVDAMIELGEWRPQFPDLVTRDEYLTTLAEIHEEIWVFDHEGFGSWLKGECSPSEAQELAETIEELGEDAEAAGIYLRECVGGSLQDFSEDDFRDHYRGRYDSERDYAEQIIEDRLDQLKATISHYVYGEREKRDVIDKIEWLGQYVDTEALARDLSFGGATYADASDGGVYVFD